LRAAVTLLETAQTASDELAVATETMRQRFHDLLDLKGVSALELRTSLKLIASPIDLVFFITRHLPLDPYAKQEIIQTVAVDEQVEQLTRLLERLIGSQLN
jgi:ATP-dependent Lon protease